MPRTMLVFAHPDDETIALGGRLGRFRTADLVHVTDGAPRNEQDSRAHGFASWREYKQARSQELAAALHVAGVAEMRREWLGIPDQQASLSLADLTLQVLERIEKRRPEVIFTHAYEGGHPDHDASAFAVHHAVRLLRRNGRQVPLIAEAAFYHAGPRGIVTGEFLPFPQPTHTVAYALMGEELRRKRAILECFTTQQETLAGFGLEWERFRVAPEYDFTQPPHSPPVLYDGFPWGMSSGRFCELAAEAESTLKGVLSGMMVAACR